MPEVDIRFGGRGLAMKVVFDDRPAHLRLADCLHEMGVDTWRLVEDYTDPPGSMTLTTPRLLSGEEQARLAAILVAGSFLAFVVGDPELPTTAHSVRTVIGYRLFGGKRVA